MKLLVTVGTTPFKSLVNFLDNNLPPETDATFQIGYGGIVTNNYPSIIFTDRIYELYESADVIITHAGAGTVFKLLEMKKKIVIVPNLERIDKHQQEIARYMNERNHALSCNNFSSLITTINNAYTASKFTIFHKKHFFVSQQIITYINNIYN